MTGHYAKARRVAEIRERRCERARIEAARALRQREAEAARAAQELDERKRAEAEARSAFFSNPADDHGTVWLIANARKREVAMEGCRDADTQRDAAHATAAQRRREYEKSHERALILEQAETRLRAVATRQAEERAQEDSEEQRR